MFDFIFMVLASDVRYDIFIEYPFKSGKDKNECSPDAWNYAHPSKRIPNCRDVGGNALVKLAPWFTNFTVTTTASRYIITIGGVSFSTITPPENMILVINFPKRALTLSLV